MQGWGTRWRSCRAYSALAVGSLVKMALTHSSSSRSAQGGGSMAYRSSHVFQKTSNGCFSHALTAGRIRSNPAPSHPPGLPIPLHIAINAALNAHTTTDPELDLQGLRARVRIGPGYHVYRMALARRCLSWLASYSSCAYARWTRA